MIDESQLVKYPRTSHVPWSEGLQSDDRMAQGMGHYEGMEVVVTEKMDGENTTMYRHGIHARSLSSLSSHPSRHWVKSLWGQMSHNLPEGYRVCGENLAAVHSIYYPELPSYFLVFSIWDKTNTCLGWDDTKDACEVLDLHTVPELYRGVYDERAIRKLFSLDKWDTMEGYVIRPADSFHFNDFQNVVTKFVRGGHVQTDEHWMHKPIEYNGLKA